MKSRFVPLTGLLFVALTIGGMLYGGEPPTEAIGVGSADKLVAAYIEQGDRFKVAVFILALAVSAFIYFGSYLKGVLDAAPGETGLLSRVMFAGVLLFAAGMATDLTLMYAMIDAADKIDPVAIQALSAYWDNDFVPFAIGIFLFNSAIALSSLLHAGIPKWLGGLAAVIAVVSATPFGMFAFPATGLWIVIASIALAVQAARTPPPAGFQPPAAA